MFGTLGHIKSVTRRHYLRDNCVIEEEQTTRDADFLNVTAWVEVASVRCRVLPAGTGDSERAQDFAGQDSIRVLKRLIVPHDTALDVGQRVITGGETYYVASLDVANTDETFRGALIIQMAGADNG